MLVTMHTARLVRYYEWLIWVYAWHNLPDLTCNPSTEDREP